MDGEETKIYLLLGVRWVFLLLLFLIVMALFACAAAPVLVHSAATEWVAGPGI